MVDHEIYRRKLEKMEELLSEISEYSGRGAIIIVEGKRDIFSLRRLGIEGNFEIATNTSLYNFTETVAKIGNEVIVLTDWDRRGDLLAVKLSGYFENFGLKPELQIRHKMKLICYKEIKDVESLYTYVSRLRLKTNCCFYSDLM